MGAADTALLGTLIAAHLGTLLYLGRKIDTRIEDTNKRIDAHSENLNNRTYEVDTKLTALIRDTSKLIAANAKGIAELGVRVDANTTGIKELRKTSENALITAKATEKVALANTEAVKEFRKTAAFQNQLLLRNNRSLGRIEGILGSRQVDEAAEPVIPLDDLPAGLDDDMEDAKEEIEERAGLSRDR